MPNSDLRLFFAVYPTQELVNTVADIQTKLGKGWKPSNLLQLHITLAFLGKVPGSKLNEIVKIGNEIASNNSKFELCSSGIKTFSANENDKPSVLYIEIFSDPLKKLSNELKEQLSEFVDPKPFKAHLTIARKKGDILSFPESIPEFSWQAKSFKLIQSKLNSNGASHSIIREFQLD